MKYFTKCTLCNRTPAVREEWNRWQSGQSTRWRVSRHRATDEKLSNWRGEREVICPGSGFAVPTELVFPQEVSA